MSLQLLKQKPENRGGLDSRLEVRLTEILVEDEPIVDKESEFLWTLYVTGSYDSPFVELEVRALFSRQEGTLHRIVSYLPKTKIEQVGERRISLSASVEAKAFKFGPQIEYGYPIKKHHITTELLSRSEVTWTFSRLDLRPGNLTVCFQGAFKVKFGSTEPLKLEMYVAARFIRRGFFRWKTVEAVVLQQEQVRRCCNNIIPRR